MSPDDIRAVFITHEHSDHVSALGVWIKKHPMPIHLPVACLPRFAGETSVEPHLCPHPPIWTQEICGMTGSKTADYLIFTVTALMLLIANIMLVYDVLTVEFTLLIVLVWYVSISILERVALKRQVRALQKICDEQYYRKG